jgi:ribosomal protein S18 acetylase RimI-like enzyme
MKLEPLTPRHFADVIALGNQVHGDNYLDTTSLQRWYQKSIVNDVNASLVAVADSGNLLGFRITYAPEQWQTDQWCTPDLWEIPENQVCYFKSSAVDKASRGLGIGKALLIESIKRTQRQSAKAGIAHIWRESPNNSAFMYFKKCGGELIKDHPRKWDWNCLHENYVCPICGKRCYCTAAEMIIRF